MTIFASASHAYLPNEYFDSDAGRAGRCQRMPGTSEVPTSLPAKSRYSLFTKIVGHGCCKNSPCPTTESSILCFSSTSLAGIIDNSPRPPPSGRTPCSCAVWFILCPRGNVVRAPTHGSVTSPPARTLGEKSSRATPRNQACFAGR